MRLPRDTLLQILQCLQRRDLDLLAIINRLLESLIFGCVSELPLRCIERAWISGPVLGRKGSMLGQMFVPAKKIRQRTEIVASDGRRIQFVGTLKDQIAWAMKALQHACVDHLSIGGISREFGVPYLSDNNVKVIAQCASTISVGRLRVQNVALSALSRQSYFDLVFSFKSLELYEDDNGRHVTDNFLQLAGARGIDLRFLSPPLLIASSDAFLPIAVKATDEGVLDYLFNPAYTMRSRQFAFRDFRPSKQFLFKLFERIHEATVGIDRVTLASCNVLLGRQKLGKYKAHKEKYTHHIAVAKWKFILFRFRTDAFCARVAFASCGVMRKFDYTTVPAEFDRVYNTC